MFGRLKAGLLSSNHLFFMKSASLIVFILISVFGLAQTNNRQESTYLKVKIEQEVTTYEFHSIQDFEKNSEKILDEISIPNPSKKKEKSTNLTVEISITVNTADESKTISGSVTAELTKVIIEVKKLRGKLIAVLIG